MIPADPSSFPFSRLRPRPWQSMGEFDSGGEGGVQQDVADGRVGSAGGRDSPLVEGKRPIELSVL